MGEEVDIGASVWVHDREQPDVEWEYKLTRVQYLWPNTIAFLGYQEHEFMVRLDTIYRGLNNEWKVEVG
jgi:hypothetical protein